MTKRRQLTPDQKAAKILAHLEPQKMEFDQQLGAKARDKRKQKRGGNSLFKIGARVSTFDFEDEL